MMRRVWMVGVVAVLALAWGLDARAATCTFEGTVNDQWSLADNWASSQKPVANDDVIVAATCRVNEAPPRLSSMLVSSSTVTLPPGTALLVTNGITMAGGTLRGEPGTPLPSVRDNDAGQPKTAVNVIKITGHGVRLERLDVAGGTSDTIYAEGTSSNRYTGIVIEDVFVHDTGDEGIQLKYADGPKYLRCKATDTGGDAFNMDNTVNGLIENCEAWGALGRHTLGHGGIYFQDCISTTARGNFFHDINMLPEHAANRCDAGIQLYKCSGTMTLYNNVIVNNFFYGCEYNAYRGSGIVIYALQNNDSTTLVKVQHNTIWNNQGKNSAGQTRGHGIHWNQKYYTGGNVKLIDNILGYPVGASGSYGKSIFIEKATGLTLAGQIGWSLLPNTVQSVPEIPVDATSITDRQPTYVGTDMTLRKSWQLQEESAGVDVASDSLDMGAIFPRIQFVIPDTTYNNGANPNAPPVPTKFVGVSDPRPTVTLEEVKPSDVVINGETATVTLKGHVKDPIADNAPAGAGADITSVDVFVDGGEYPVTSKTVIRTQDGSAAFWRQHPYKGTFDPISVNVPLTEGTHSIRVKTSANAAGNTGYAEVALTLEKREIPGSTPGGGSTLTANIYMPNNPSPWVADTIKFYYGERGPQDGDSVLTEKTAEARFALAWGTAGAGNGQFSAPADVAVDASGNVYVLDSGNSRVQKFDKSGTFLLAWGAAGTEDGQFNQPKGIGVDSSGNVYVADTGNNRVQKFTSAGVFALKFGAQGSGDGQFSSPTDAAVDGTGNIYVVDQCNHRIQKCASDGSFLAKWGSQGAGDGQLDAPTSIAAASDGKLYVTDTNNDRIVKYDTSGTVLMKWASAGTEEGKLYRPLGIAVDNGTTVYVCDGGNHRIQRFDPATGAFELAWGIKGTEEGLFDFEQAGGLAVGTRGRVYIADAGNNRVQKLIVSEATLTFKSAWGAAGGGNGQFNQPADVAADSSGNVYVLDSGNNRVQKFDAAGAFLLAWGSEGAGDGQFSQPKGMGMDSSGNIHVADTGNNRIQKFTPAGTFVSKFGSQGAGDGQFDAPADVAIDASGNIYVVDQNNNRIQKFSADGSFAAKWGSQGAGDGQFNSPGSLALDGAGNVFVADSGNHRIQKFSAAGTFLLKWGTQGTDSCEFSAPGGIAVDGTNRIYVCDAGNNRLQRFDPNGTFQMVWGVAGTGSGQFSFAGGGGISTEASGHVLVVERGGNRVQKLLASEATLVFRGLVGGVRTSVSIDKSTFQGLTPQVDSFTALVLFDFYSNVELPISSSYSETASESQTFRAVWSVVGGGTGGDGTPEPQGRWIASDARKGDASGGSYMPLSLRVKGLPAADGYLLFLDETKFDLEALPDGWMYPLSDSEVIIGVLEENGQFSKVYYNRKTSAVEKTAIPAKPTAKVTRAEAEQDVLTEKKGSLVKTGLTKIVGMRANVLNDYGQENDPRKDGRLFTDTEDDGTINASLDKQRIKITVKVDLKDAEGFTEAELNDRVRVRWEVYDPDDPASHPDIDGKKVGDKLEHDPNGGDNTGTRYESAPAGAGGQKHWFDRADHDLDGDPLNYEADKTKLLPKIGEAKTKITKVGEEYVSSIHFYYSDDGGDNFRIRAVMVAKTDKGDWGDVADDGSGMLTVWRKYTVITNAAVYSGDASELAPIPSPDTFRAAYGDITKPDLNPYIDMKIEEHAGICRVGSVRQPEGGWNVQKGDTLKLKVDDGVEKTVTFNNITAGAATAAELKTEIDAAGIQGLTTRLEDGGKRVILEAAKGIEITSNWEQRDYGDWVVGLWGDNVAGNRRWSSYRMPDLEADLPVSEVATYWTGYPSAHPNHTVHLMGWARSSHPGKLGGTIAPHAYVSVKRILELGGKETAITHTAIHEVGHTIYTVGTDAAGHDTELNGDSYHKDASKGYEKNVAAGSVESEDGFKGSVGTFSPRHVAKLRTKVLRAWPADGQGLCGE